MRVQRISSRSGVRVCHTHMRPAYSSSIVHQATESLLVAGVVLCLSAGYPFHSAVLLSMMIRRPSAFCRSFLSRINLFPRTCDADSEYIANEMAAAVNDQFLPHSLNFILSLCVTIYSHSWVGTEYIVQTHDTIIIICVRVYQHGILTLI